MLTIKQQIAFDIFLKVVENNQNYLLSSEDRRIGKTYILNELGFTLQALGYKVYVLTPYKEQEYYANKFITNADGFRGLLTNKSVVIADEARYVMMSDIIEYCKYRNVPIVGYVNYHIDREIKPQESKTEYDCVWISDTPQNKGFKKIHTYN